jgi:predicted nucleic acid-binding Zn ribbon protein
MFDEPQITCQVCQAVMGRVPAGITPRFIGKDFYSNDKNA